MEEKKPTCARCQDVCPAYASGKDLNPMQIIHDVRHYANENVTTLMAGEAPEQDIIARFGESSIWACTTCHACVEACPIYIDHVPKLTDARRHLMMERIEFDESVEETVMPLMATIENLESDSNPYGLPAHERGEWADGLDVKVAEPAEYIYFAGCAASFDERNKKVARDTISIMKEAGLDVGILGMQEGCSGDAARRAGNEYLFQMLAETNLSTFEEIGVKKIVASCPHCFHTLGKEYKDYGGEDIEVMHHSQLINHLQIEGKLPQPQHDGSVTFHDPCYLGRIGGELDAPRNAIGGVDVEAERHGRESFCCGAGGACLALLFPDNEGSYDIIMHSFIPSDNAHKRSERDKVDYLKWHREGYVDLTPGDVCDYNYIKQKIRDISEKFDVQMIAYDRWNASQIVIDLTEEGCPMIPVGQGYRTMSPATKEFETLILAGSIRHGGNPVLRWMMSNVVLALDPAGNVKPNKAKSNDKIDGIVACLMGLSEAMQNKNNGGSAYDDREIFFI